MEDPLGTILIILGLLLLNGFIVLAETALISSRKSRLRAKAEEGNKKYRRVLRIAENSSPYLLSLKIWICFLGILTGVLGGRSMVRPLETIFAAQGFSYPLGNFFAVILVVGAVTLGAVTLGIGIPKKLALLAPEKISAAVLPVIIFLTGLLNPLIFLFYQGSKLLRAVFRLEKPLDPGITEDELRIALREGEKSGIVERQERTMVEGVFYLGDRPVGTFMTHRSEITWLDIRAGPEEARKTALEFRDQRYFPVAKGTLDDVVGLVYVQDIFLALLEEPWRGLKAILKSPRFVPETMTALKAFEVFKQGDSDLVFVMDEYGGFSGVLSVRDLVEEIVGELSDSTRGGEEILRQDDGTYLAEGSVNIDDIAKALSLSSLSGDHQNYHTLAGFILSLAGEIPKIGAHFDWNGFRFKIIAMEGNRIDKVLILPPKEDSP
ncbi:hemolysin family protein [Treponema sp. TIM-1]|uniref:hemolysin family protein n=1 Tax=Treponema sp. TIM-1 TaxID=2898417 RepID=UPI0039808411